MQNARTSMRYNPLLMNFNSPKNFPKDARPMEDYKYDPISQTTLKCGGGSTTERTGCHNSTSWDPGDDLRPCDKY